MTRWWQHRRRGVRRASFALGGFVAAIGLVVAAKATGPASDTSFARAATQHDAVAQTVGRDSPLANSRSRPVGADFDGPDPRGGPGIPCLGAVHGLPGATLKTSIPIWLPADPGNRVTDAWTCDGAPVLMFGNIQVSYEPGWADLDEQKQRRMWTAIIAEDGSGELSSVHGHLAYIYEHIPAWHTNDEVAFVVGDTLVRLLSSADIPVHDLLTFADTLRIPESAAAPLNRN